MIIVKVGGSEKLRFEPHQVGDTFVITPRRGRAYPIPVGAELFDGDELLGVVLHVLPQQFQRCQVTFEPLAAEVEEFEPLVAVGIGEILSDIQRPTDAAAGDLEKLFGEEPSVEPMWGTGHDDSLPGDTMHDVAPTLPDQPLEDSTLSDRLLGVLAGHGITTRGTLQALFDQGDALLSLSGIGPRSLAEIELVLAQADDADTRTARAGATS